jgi:hypothetical protein
MGLILGMDAGVFIAWFLTILTAIICVLYGIYYNFIKKTNEMETSKQEKKGKRNIKKGEK